MFYGWLCLMVKFLLIFTLIPLIELWLIIEIGRLLGALPTVLLVAATGFIGVMLLKAQGIVVIYRIREELYRGEVPTDSLFGGLFILLGGAFLLTPGLITDILGFSFIVPITRYYIIKWARKLIGRAVRQGNIYIWRW